MLADTILPEVAACRLVFNKSISPSLKTGPMKPGLKKNFTDDLVNEFILKRETSLAKIRENADAILSGVIWSMTVETISHTGTVTSDERRVKVAVHLKLRNRKNRIVWSNVVTEDETFVVADSKLETERNQREAIITLSQRFAEKAYNRLTTDF